MKTISAVDANRHFSSLLRDVATGECVTVLSRGKPVATIGPVARESASRLLARQALLERLRQTQAQATGGARYWTRDELYER